MKRPLVIQGLFVGVCMLVGLAIFSFGERLAPKKRGPIDGMATAGMPPEVPEFDYNEHFEITVDQQPGDFQDEIEHLIGLRANAESEEEITKALNDLIATFDGKGLEIIAMEYSYELAQRKATAEAWAKTADNYVLVAYKFFQEAPKRFYLFGRAIESYQNALELNPEDMDTRIKLASSYFEGTNNPMPGVTILRNILADDPENLEANLILGRYGVVSGLYPNAISRLERALEIDSSNLDAHVLLAEAWLGNGDQTKAIEYLQMGRSLVTDPAVQADFDTRIEQIRNIK